MGPSSACIFSISHVWSTVNCQSSSMANFVSLCLVQFVELLMRPSDHRSCKTKLCVTMGSGGSAKQARDRRFQAILPLRGKILNVERKDDASLYKNNEISNLIVGLGLGLKGEDVTNLRYGKVCCPASTCV